MPGGTFSAPMIQHYQAPSSAGMIMHSPQAPSSAQMMMHPPQSQMMMLPQQFRSFAQPVIHPQQPQGSSQAMMGAQQSYRSPQAVNGTHQAPASAPMAMRSPAAHASGHPMMHPHQAPRAKMTNSEILTFAHGVMNPMQFLAFAQALAQPQGSGPIASPQPFQGSTTSKSPKSVEGGPSPSPVMSPVQSHSSSPGNSPLQVHGSSAAMSPQQPQGLSTPAMSEAPEMVSPAPPMTPQRSQGPTQGIVSAQQFKGYTQVMSGPLPSWAPAQAMIAHQQSHGPPQGLMTPQQHAAPALNLTMMASHSIHPSNSNPTSEVANGPAADHNKPYRGIIPPSKTRPQGSQLGMLHHFFAGRSPLSPAVSMQNRVTKRSATKPGIRPQLPISPVSAPEHAANESAGIQITCATSQNEDTMTKAVDYTLKSATKEDQMDVTPDMAVGVDTLFQDDGALFGPMLEDNTTAVVSAEVDTLFVQDNASKVPAKVDTSAKQTSAGVEETTSPESQMFHLLMNDNGQFGGSNRTSKVNSDNFVNEFPEFVDYDQAEGSAGVIISSKSSKVDEMSIEAQYTHDIRQDLPSKGEPVQTAPEETAAKAAGVEKMSIEEQYLYGIRQGLPNNGVRVGAAA
jgi:hypothetical protein